MTAAGDIRPPLEVTVTPAQSSFFAGEELRCLITFTNNNVPVPASLPLPSLSRFQDPFGDSFHHDHSRRIVSHMDNSSPAFGHSKSQSFDVRKGQAKTLKQGIAGYGDDDEAAGATDDLLDLDGNPLPARKRMIGRNALPRTPDNRSTAAPDTKHIKSASVAAFSPTPHSELASQSRLPDTRSPAGGIGMGLPGGHAAWQAARVASDADRSAVTPSSNASSRRPSATIQPSHPHSRKKSVIQMQHEDLSAAFELSTSVATQTPREIVGNTIYAHSVNPSEVSLAQSQDGLTTPRMSLSESRGVNAEASNPFYNMGRNDTMESVVRDQLTNWSRGAPHPERRLSIPSATDSINGLATPSTRPQAGASPLFPQPASVAPGVETILWSFAQFAGSYEIDESLIKPAEFEDVKRRLAYGDGLTSPAPPGTPRTIGGGHFGHEDGADVAAASGWAAYLRSAIGSGPASYQGRHRRTGSTMLDSRHRTMTSKTIPVFSAPPSVLAVDLTLLPGESKTYSFSMQLPSDLPPSFFGKAIKFNYELVIGTNRVDHRRAAAKVGNQMSRLIKIPLRLYNHVNITGARPYFDLTNPVILLRDEASVREDDKAEEDGKCAGTKAPFSAQDFASARRQKEESERGHQALRRYTRSLLASCQDNDPTSSDAPTDFEKALKRLTSPQNDDGEMLEGFTKARRGSGIPGLSITEDDESNTCKGAVEVLSRNSSKVSYDISKDGQIAAVLTLIKSKYRLGDTILGVVTINPPASVARVVRIAAVLESYEEIEASLSTLPAGRVHKMTRTLHAEHHENTLDAGQASFSLPIPSGATPDFLTSGVKLHWVVRLSFLTLVCDKDAPSSAAAAAPATRAPPPPHLYPCPDEDGFGLYHSTHRAVPSLAGHLPPGLAPPSKNAATGARTKLEIVECAVPVTVLPNSTSFRAGPVTFAV